MPHQRLTYLDEIKDWFSRLETSIKANQIIQHQSVLIELENFYRELLNLVYEWNLSNANIAMKNQDSYDLLDEMRGIAVQVTVTMNAAKIRQTLIGIADKHGQRFKRVIFAYPFITLQKTTANFHDLTKGYDFDPIRDRIGLGTILREAQNMNIDKQKNLVELLRKELIPLKTALPTEPNNSIPIYRPCNLPSLSLGTLFKGRADILKELDVKYSSPLNIPKVLFGLGGVGKSRIALE